ncbi:hypothetical protein FRX31_025459 [Thalictrum thalictroides]|uniref:Retrotransposon gag domain-containing protein n=1 Tax=Thalictrum thalictroides TaxID=46969 RepID=A0A7J6VIM8_THATH|nr:hypothetical protein FRX31_025459 [Thalictrum thalictroides]
MTWDDFKDLFEAKYISWATKEEMIERFTQLRQGSMTVTEYVAEFNKLSKFAPYMIDTREKKVGKFIRGLSYHLQVKVLPSEQEPFERVMSLALRMEQLEKEFRDSR